MLAFHQFHAKSFFACDPNADLIDGEAAVVNVAVTSFVRILDLL